MSHVTILVVVLVFIEGVGTSWQHGSPASMAHKCLKTENETFCGREGVKFKFVLKTHPTGGADICLGSPDQNSRSAPGEDFFDRIFFFKFQL